MKTANLNVLLLPQELYNKNKQEQLIYLNSNLTRANELINYMYDFICDLISSDNDIKVKWNDKITINNKQKSKLYKYILKNNDNFSYVIKNVINIKKNEFI